MSAATAVPTGDRSISSVLRGALLGGGAALVVDLAIWALGRLTTPVRVVSGWAPEGADVTAFEVVATAVVSVALGAALLALLAKVRRDPFTLWAGLAAAFAALSAVPLWKLDIGTGSKAALTAMHLLTGVAAVAGQALANRYATDS
jgi:hypothetical protein